MTRQTSYPQGSWGREILHTHTPYKTEPNTFPLLFFLYIPTLTILVTLASGGLWLCEPLMEIQVRFSKGDRQTWVSFPQPLHVINLK